MPTRFERDTAVERTDDDSYRATLDPGWCVVRGPNGGYIAAIILRAITESIGDDTRVPRSLTVHFVARPDVGDVIVRTTIERAGRSLTSCSARMYQDDRVVAIAIAACSRPREAPEFCDLTMPEAAPAADLTPVPLTEDVPPFARRWETRWAVGTWPFAGELNDEAVGGGWSRLEEPQPFDAPAIAALSDALVPAVFRRTGVPLVVPTIDLTVHFRSALPYAGLADDAFALAVFRTSVAAEGFLEEDGEIWAPDGTLLAHSRQLAAILPLP